MTLVREAARCGPVSAIGGIECPQVKLTIATAEDADYTWAPLATEYRCRARGAVGDRRHHDDSALLLQPGRQASRRHLCCCDGLRERETRSRNEHSRRQKGGAEGVHS